MELLRGLEFSLSIGCKLDCKFCPQELITKKYFNEFKKSIVHMSLTDFKCALKNVEPGGFVSFSGMAEPFHNPDCAKMVKYAYDNGYRVFLFTTLVGMKKADLELLKHVKLDYFVLHIPDKENYCNFIVDEDYLELVQEVQKFFTPNEYSCHGMIHPEIKSYIDPSIRTGIDLCDRAGNLQNIDISKREKDSLRKSILCVHGFGTSVNQWIPVCLPDGTLVACCQDYGMRHIFGNLLESRWEKIKEGSEYRSFRKSWYSPNRECLCSNCGSARPIEQLPSIKLASLLDKTMEVFRTFSAQERKLIRLLQSKKTRVIYGAGNYLKDHYQYMKWDKVLQAECIVDKDASLWGTEIFGLICVSIEKIKKDALIIVFIKQAETIVRELKEQGYENVIEINDIFALGACL